MMTVSSDDGASSCRNAIAKPSDPGLGRDELVDEVFNPAADLVTDGSDGTLGPLILSVLSRVASRQCLRAANRSASLT